MSALPPASAPATESPEPSKPEPKQKKHTPHGRRKPDDLSHLPVVVMRIEPELSDEERAGAEEIGIDVTESLEYKPAGYVRFRCGARSDVAARLHSLYLVAQADQLIRGSSSPPSVKPRTERLWPDG